MNTVIKNLAFLSASAGVGLYSLANTSYSALEFGSRDMLKGEVAQSLEARFENALPIKEFGVNLWSAFRYVVFGAGETGLVIGQSGWLFTDEEFFAPENADVNLVQNLKTIAGVSDLLANRGVELVVVPVPAKARVHQDKLETRPDSFHQHLYGNFIDFLANQHITHIDTAQTFLASGGDLYFKTDTHWLPEAAALVASELGATYGNQNARQFEVIEVGHATLRGDLLNYVPVDPWFSSIAPPQELLSTFNIVPISSELDLFADAPAPEVALVGTSYSANSAWNFEGALKLELNRDVMNFATEGEGPITPMLSFIENYLDQLPELELVVWEIPERYLATNHATELPMLSIPATQTLAANTNF